MQNSFRATFLALFFYLVPNYLFAQDGSFTSIHHQYQEARALGMGDAFTAVADDYSAIFYNPAGLAWLNQGQFNGAIDVNLSSQIQQFNKDLSAANSNTDSTVQYQQIAELLSRNYGKVYGTRVGALQGIYARPKWGIALIPMDLKTEFSVINQGTPGVSVRAIADSTLAFGYGNDIRGLSSGRLAWGTTVKLINRGYFSKSVNALDILIDGNNIVKTSDMREGYTIDFDLGTLYRPDIPDEGFLSYFRSARPTFAMVVRNVLDSGFRNTFRLLNKESNKAQPPENLNRVLDLGSRWEYPKAWIFGGRGTLDIRDIGHPQWTTRKSIHAGFEFDWTMRSWWKGHYRVGLSQMYPTAGLSMLLGVFRLDLSTYSEEVGTATAPKENRYYQAKLNLDF